MYGAGLGRRGAGATRLSGSYRRRGRRRRPRSGPDGRRVPAAGSATSTSPDSVVAQQGRPPVHADLQRAEHFQFRDLVHQPLLARLPLLSARRLLTGLLFLPQLFQFLPEGGDHLLQGGDDVSLDGLRQVVRPRLGEQVGGERHVRQDLREGLGEGDAGPVVAEQREGLLALQADRPLRPGQLAGLGDVPLLPGVRGGVAGRGGEGDGAGEDLLLGFEHLLEADLQRPQDQFRLLLAELAENLLQLLLRLGDSLRTASACFSRAPSRSACSSSCWASSIAFFASSICSAPGVRGGGSPPSCGSPCCGWPDLRRPVLRLTLLGLRALAAAPPAVRRPAAARTAVRRIAAVLPAARRSAIRRIRFRSPTVPVLRVAGVALGRLPVRRLPLRRFPVFALGRFARLGLALFGIGFRTLLRGFAVGLFPVRLPPFAFRLLRRLARRVGLFDAVEQLAGAVGHVGLLAGDALGGFAAAVGGLGGLLVADEAAEVLHQRLQPLLFAVDLLPPVLAAEQAEDRPHPADEFPLLLDRVPEVRRQPRRGVAAEQVGDGGEADLQPFLPAPVQRPHQQVGPLRLRLAEVPGHLQQRLLERGELRGDGAFGLFEGGRGGVLGETGRHERQQYQPGAQAPAASAASGTVGTTHVPAAPAAGAYAPGW